MLAYALSMFERLLQYGMENLFLSAVAILALSAVAGHLMSYLINNVIRKLTLKTKTTWDDVLLEALDRPILICAYAGGAWLGLHTIGLNVETLGGWYNAYRSLIVFIATYAVVLTSNNFFSLYEQKVLSRGGSPVGSTVIPIAQKVVPTLIIFLGFVIALNIFSIDVTPFLAGAGIAGLAIGLAFQDTLSNFFAGVYITADQPIREGDYIRIEGGDEGVVQQIGWRSTRIVTLQNNMVLVPNAKLTQSVITNYYLPEPEMSFSIPVSVSYDSDLERVEGITIDVAQKVVQNTTGAVKTFIPFIRYNKFAESGIDFSVILKVNRFVDRYLLTHEFIKALHARFRKEKLEIPYPKRDVFVRKARRS